MPLVSSILIVFIRLEFAFTRCHFHGMTIYLFELIRSTRWYVFLGLVVVGLVLVDSVFEGTRRALPALFRGGHHDLVLGEAGLVNDVSASMALERRGRSPREGLPALVALAGVVVVLVRLVYRHNQAPRAFPVALKTRSGRDVFGQSGAR